MTRHRIITAVAATLLVALFALVVVGAASADVGTLGADYTGATAPTGEKPQSKTWFHDGTWWAVMYNPTSGAFEIYKRANDAWTTTGTLVDGRDRSWQDVMWDGNHLQVVSSGTSPSDPGMAVRYSRLGYDASTGRWTTEIPQQAITNYGVEVAVLDRDSTGTVWITWTHNSTVYVAHSTTDQSTWSNGFAIPVPNSNRLSSDDISSIVSFNGHIGVMYSDQAAAGSPDNFYWATHRDGDDEKAWTVESALTGIEMADDHINLKAIDGDPAVQVLAAVKTSLNRSNEPQILLLSLDDAGTWHSTPVLRVSDGTPTRAQVAIDKSRREAYVFAAEGPCCTGGAIFMKKASLDDLTFPVGTGIPVIQSATDKKINNVNTPKQTLSAATDLPVLASDDKTRHYWHTLIKLDGTDIAPPETSIVTGPAGTTSATTAEFAFSSDEVGSTFSCSLDGAAFTSCTSPTTYSALAAGTHNFAVRATDAAGNLDPTPATRSWSVADSPSLFADGFESGDFAQWSQVLTALDGTATVQSSTVAFGAYSARLSATATKGSVAYIRKTLDAPATTLTVLGSLRIDGEGPVGGNVPLLRLYDPAGTRLVSLYRPNGNTKIYVGHSGVNVATAGRLSTGTFARFEVDVTTAGTGASTVTVRVNGAVVYSSNTADLGTAGVSTIQLGNDTKNQPFIVYADDVEVR